MAKKQTRRSISVSRTTYERLKAFCETNNISMSQLVETRVNDFLGAGEIAPPPPAAPRPTPSYGSSIGSFGGSLSTQAAPAPRAMMPSAPPRSFEPRPVHTAPSPSAAPVASSAPSAPVAPSATPVTASTPSTPAPMTSAAARFAVDPPPPIIKPRQDTAAPKPAEKRPEQIFTF